MFSIDKTEKPRCHATHTHTHSHKFMHLFTGNIHCKLPAGALSHAYFKEHTDPNIQPVPKSERSLQSANSKFPREV